MMIPITRKEKYINEIVGGGDTAPETPQTREEFFFAEILGEVIAPSPVTRVEKYLSAIAGQYSGELPEPVTRIERFIARAAGMDVTIPTPITREEMLWANYALIVEKELSGIPPLTFKAKKAGTLNNYRIYGNTVNGENVGDLITEGEHAGEYSVPVTVTNGTDTETTNLYLPEPIKMVGDEAEYIDYAEQKQHRVRKNLLPNTATSQTKNGVTFTVNDEGIVTISGSKKTPGLIYFDMCFVNTDDINGKIFTGYYGVGSSYNNGMLFRLSPLDESIGVDVLSDNTTINLDSGLALRLRIRLSVDLDAPVDITVKPMIRKADIEDDTYEPYIEDTELDVTLPALPVLPGTNTLSVGTEVQPSNVYIKYEGVR